MGGNEDRSARRAPKSSSRGGDSRRGQSGRDSVRRTPISRSGEGRRTEEKPPTVHLDDEIVKELRATTRPGKAEILIKVFAEAAGAFATDDYVEAIRLGEQAKHIALRSGTVRELLGLAYYRIEQWKESARELAAFRRLSGSTEQNPVIADCYRAMGKPEKAVEICEEIDPRKVEPAVAFEGAIVAASALAEMKRLDDAIDKLEKLDLRPASAEEHHLRAWYVLGDLLERKGRFTQAREWFQAVNGAGPEFTDAGERLAHLGKRG